MLIKGNDFLVYNGMLTVVTGENGTGKSTLLRHLCSLLKNGKHGRVSIAAQDGVFFEHLTIREHSEMMKKLYGGYDAGQIVEILQLESVLDRYPSQLSNGEKKRASLFLSLLENADIYVLDEPTASVNAEIAGKYLLILDELRKQGKIIIVSTHARVLTDASDIHYDIHNKQLYLEKFTDTAYAAIASEHKNADLSDIGRFIALLRKRKSFIFKLMELFLFICCAAAGVLYSRWSLAYKAQQKAISKMESNEIVVFKEGPLTENSAYPDNIAYQLDRQEPFSDEEIQILENIDHVSEVKGRYDIVESVQDNNDITIDPFVENERKDTVTVLENGIEVSEIELDYIRISSSYDSDHMMVNDIENDFNSDGVFLSKAAADLISSQLNVKAEELEGKSLRLMISVPLYNTYGRVMGGYDESSLSYIYSTTVKRVEVEIAVAGILKGQSFGIPVYDDNAYVIYYPQDFLENLIEEYRRSDDRVVYGIGPLWDEYYINELPDRFNGDVNRTMNDTVWRPSAYSVYVDGIENIRAVMQEIKKNGYCAISESAQSGSYGSYIQGVLRIFRLGTVILSAGIIAAAIAMELFNRKRRKCEYSYFEKINIDIQTVKHSEVMYALKQTFISAAAETAVLGAYVVYEYIRFGFIIFSWTGAAITLFLILLVKFMIPAVFIKKMG